MTRSIRKSLVGLALAGLTAGCTGVVSTGGMTGPGAGTGTGSTSGTGSSSGTGSTSGTGSGGNTTTPTGSGGNTTTPTGSGGNTTTPTGSGGNTTTTGSGGSTVTPGTGGNSMPMPGITCTPGIPGTSQVPRMTVVQYSTVMKDLLGMTTLANNTPFSSILAPDSSAPITDIMWNGYLTAAEKIAAEVMAGANKSKFIACDPATGTCLADTVKTFGRKIFRRPLTTAEQTSFMRLNSLTPKGTPAEVAEAILYAFLASPSFIMLPELAQDMDGTSLKLNSYEVASRLSFLLWNSIPDDALNTAADGGMLTTKDQIKTQAQRLLTSPKAAGVARSFHQYYADITGGSHWVNNTTHNATKFPNFNSASYSAAMAELDAFFQDIVVGGGTFKDLFTSPQGYVTKDTAALYGVTSTATTPTKMMLDATKRPGFLTRVGFLSTFAHDDTSSPILRGAFILGRVLGIPTGTPDPRFLMATPPAGNYTTNREAMDALTMPAPCNTCHTTKINPPGYVLERYNAVGTWQDKDPLGGDINSTADVYVTSTTTKKITTPAELMAELAASPAAQKVYAQQWVAYAAARSPNANDACIVDQLANSLATNATYTVAGMMADYTQADSFRLRTLGQ